MRSMSSRFSGKSAALCPDCGLLTATPLTKMVSWSKVPPSTLRSVWTPKPPRWRTSTPAANLSTSLILVTPAAARSRRVSVITCRATTSVAKGAREADTTASSRRVSLSSRCDANVSPSSTLQPVAAINRGVALSSVATPSTPTRTSRPKQEKRA